MNHGAMSTILLFSSQIYCEIHELGNEFFLNRMKKTSKPSASERKRKKPFQSQLSKAAKASE